MKDKLNDLRERLKETNRWKNIYYEEYIKEHNEIIDVRKQLEKENLYCGILIGTTLIFATLWLARVVI